MDLDPVPQKQQLVREFYKEYYERTRKEVAQDAKGEIRLNLWITRKGN